MHVPALTKVRVDPETVHTPAVDEARDTVNPESDDAVRVAVPDESDCAPGSLNVMVCDFPQSISDRSTLPLVISNSTKV